MAKRTFTITSSALASRRGAAKLRADIDAALLQGQVQLDVSAVQSVSESWADELFGVLVVRRSLPWVFARLSLRGANQDVARTIASAIRYRLTREANGGDVAALLTAQAALRERRASREPA